MKIKLVALLSISSYFIAAYFLSAFTPQQLEFLKEMETKKQVLWVQETCEEKNICEEYINIRNSCSSAGDFDNCVKVKSINNPQMERMNLSAFKCSESGKVQLMKGKGYEYGVIPSELQCKTIFARRFTSLFSK